jgi:zinc protease
MRCHIAVVFGLAIAVLPSRAQTVDRGVQPVPGPSVSFKTPRVDTARLVNGLRVAIVENHALPLVAVRLVVGVDSTWDPRGKEGLAVITQAMLSEGTTTRTPDDIALAAAAIGTPFTPTSFTTVTSKLDASLALMADVVSHPAFPAASLQRRRDALVANAKRQLEADIFFPRRIFYIQTLGAENPMFHAATEASVASITREDVVGFYERYWRPNNATLVLAGDVRAADVLPRIARAFADWKARTVPSAREIPAPPPATATRIYLLDTSVDPTRPDSQAYVYVGAAGPTRQSSDLPALEALATIVGNAVGSRVALNLSSRRGLVYSGSGLSADTRRGAPLPSPLVGVYRASARKVDTLVREWLKDLGDIGGARPPTPEEMKGARASRIGNLASMVETADSVAARVADRVRNGEPFDWFDRYVERMTALTPADVAAAARKYVDPARVVIVVAANRTIVEPILRAANIAPVVVVDKTGKPLP